MTVRITQARAARRLRRAAWLEGSPDGQALAQQLVYLAEEMDRQGEAGEVDAATAAAYLATREALLGIQRAAVTGA